MRAILNHSAASSEAGRLQIMRHELLHAYSNGPIRKFVGFDLHEGMTEYLATNGFEKRYEAYSDAKEFASKLDGFHNELAEYYFGGDDRPVWNLINKKIGGDWKGFHKVMSPKDSKGRSIPVDWNKANKMMGW